MGLGDINRWALSSKLRHQPTQSSGVFKVELREDEAASQLARRVLKVSAVNGIICLMEDGEQLSSWSGSWVNFHPCLPRASSNVCDCIVIT